MDMTASVVLSAFIAVFYTFSGGLYAVAYTDVVQLFCIFIGLWVCIPAALLQKKTSDLSENAMGWIGEIGGFREKLLWMDCMLLLVFGGIPWQVNIEQGKHMHTFHSLNYNSGLFPTGPFVAYLKGCQEIVICGWPRLHPHGHSARTDWGNCQEHWLIPIPIFAIPHFLFFT
jgi:hypothetical protein